MATHQPTITLTGTPSTLMVLVDYDPGGDYDHRKPFLLLTFEDALDKDALRHLRERLQTVAQVWTPSDHDPEDYDTISVLATMRKVVTECADFGAPVASVQVIDGYTYLDSRRHDVSAPVEEPWRQSDHATYTVANTGD